jgi:SAM-dependent methyltransferase
MDTSTQTDPAAAAYDGLAPYYDEFTTGYAHEAWVAGLIRQATELGLRGRRALDLACGTGKSTVPLLSRGYSVVACDISEGMVREARRKHPEHADAFRVADMRRLPALGEFDLVLCLDDAVNYLLSEDDLAAMFTSVAGALAPQGIFVFDLNTLATYRSTFARAIVRETKGLFFTWIGEGTMTLAPGEIVSATVETFAERQDGLWERRSSHHIQRHHSAQQVEDSLTRAGLDCSLIVGQLPGAQLEATLDEDRHTKVVYFAQFTKRKYH